MVSFHFILVRRDTISLSVLFTACSKHRTESLQGEYVLYVQLVKPHFTRTTEPNANCVSQCGGNARVFIW